VAFLLLFFVISYFSERRHADAGEFGGLYSRRTAAPAQVSKPHYEVISEAPVAESSVDPLSLESARKDQILGVSSTAPVLNGTIATANVTAAPMIAGKDFRPLSRNDESSGKKESRFKIVGGSEGVNVEPR
jgi:hypothetical protein